MSDWVLLRTRHTFGDIRPYDVMQVADWVKVENHKLRRVSDWEEVARGTEEELRVLVKLMPETRLMFD